MGHLEINMTIKCGECIRYDNYSFERNGTDLALALLHTINNAGFGKFSARQQKADEMIITCLHCGHEDLLNPQ